jgi:hypothetical protein
MRIKNWMKRAYKQGQYDLIPMDVLEELKSRQVGVERAVDAMLQGEVSADETLITLTEELPDDAA